ncbi:hypothetical protein ACFX1S_043841 [Malus domestica]
MAHQMSSSNHDPNSDSSKARIYNPYQDLQVPMRNLYQLPTSPEFLFVKEAKRQRHSWVRISPSTPAASTSQEQLEAVQPISFSVFDRLSLETPPSSGSVGILTPLSTRVGLGGANWA